jgi:hypothetical protein
MLPAGRNFRALKPRKLLFGAIILLTREGLGFQNGMPGIYCMCKGKA